MFFYMNPDKPFQESSKEKILKAIKEREKLVGEKMSANEAELQSKIDYIDFLFKVDKDLARAVIEDSDDERIRAHFINVEEP